MNYELIMFNHLFKHLFEIVKFYCATNVLIVRENFDTIEKNNDLINNDSKNKS